MNSNQTLEAIKERQLRADLAAPSLAPAITFRAILLGLIGVCFINLLTPFNDFVLSGASMIGSHLPAGLLLFFVAFIMAVNGPLSRFWPRWVFRRGELSVALSMVLVGCALPGVGVMRGLPGNLAAMWYHSATDLDAADLIRQLNLPDWIFPTVPAGDPAVRGINPVIQQFYNGAPLGDQSFMHRLLAVPWAAWARPALTWGILLVAMFGAIILMAILFRRQWADNERIPFPLASVFVSLVEPPRPGRWVNELFRAPAFWLTVLCIFSIHAVAGMHQYFSQSVPDLPLRFDLHSVLTEGWLADAEDDFKSQGIFFAIIGIVFFVRSSLTFSMWFIFLLVQIERIAYARNQLFMTEGMENDQMFGAIIPIGLSILFVGRHHLKMVARQMFRGRGKGPDDHYLSYSLVGWGLLACLAGMVIWLMAAGASLIGAAVLVCLMMLVFLVLMRIVSETGLLYVLTPIPLSQPWLYLSQNVPHALAARTTMRSFFYSRLFFMIFVHDTRESLPGFIPNALRVGDIGAGFNTPRKGARPGRFIACLVLALFAAYFVSGASTLWIHYNFPNTLDPTHGPINDWAVNRAPRAQVIEYTLDYLPPRTGISEAHWRLAHFAAGAAIATALSVMRLRYAGWPLEPLGYFLVYTWGLQQIWFSIFLGWLAKCLVIGLGGSRAFRKARPVFIGIIIGDSVAAAFWLSVTFIMAITGHQYHVIGNLP